MNFCNVWLNDNLSSKPLFKVKSRQSSTALGLLAALGLSACGAGGSKTSPTNNSNSNSTTSNDNNVTLPSDTIDNTLTLTRSGTDYSTSTMAGFFYLARTVIIRLLMRRAMPILSHFLLVVPVCSLLSLLTRMIL